MQTVPNHAETVPLPCNIPIFEEPGAAINDICWQHSVPRQLFPLVPPSRTWYFKLIHWITHPILTRTTTLYYSPCAGPNASSIPTNGPFSRTRTARNGNTLSSPDFGDAIIKAVTHKLTRGRPYQRPILRFNPAVSRPVVHSLRAPSPRPSKAGLGLLVFPIEILCEMVRCMDVRSVIRFRQVNQRTREMVSSVAEYRHVAEFALDVVLALHRVELARHVCLMELHALSPHHRCLLRLRRVREASLFADDAASHASSCRRAASASCSSSSREFRAAKRYMGPSFRSPDMSVLIFPIPHDSDWTMLHLDNRQSPRYLLIDDFRRLRTQKHCGEGFNGDAARHLHVMAGHGRAALREPAVPAVHVGRLPCLGRGHWHAGSCSGARGTGRWSCSTRCCRGQKR